MLRIRELWEEEECTLMLLRINYHQTSLNNSWKNTVKQEFRAFIENKLIKIGTSLIAFIKTTITTHQSRSQRERRSDFQIRTRVEIRTHTVAWWASLIGVTMYHASESWDQQWPICPTMILKYRQVKEFQFCSNREICIRLEVTAHKLIILELEILLLRMRRVIRLL